MQETLSPAPDWVEHGLFVGWVGNFDFFATHLSEKFDTVPNDFGWSYFQRFRHPIKARDCTFQQLGMHFRHTSYNTLNE